MALKCVYLIWCFFPQMEEESAESDGEEKDPSYTDMPGTSADDEQAGPSGMGKDGVEAP